MRKLHDSVGRRVSFNLQAAVRLGTLKRSHDAAWPAARTPPRLLSVNGIVVPA